MTSYMKPICDPCCSWSKPLALGQMRIRSAYFGVAPMIFQLVSFFQTEANSQLCTWQGLRAGREEGNGLVIAFLFGPLAGVGKGSGCELLPLLILLIEKGWEEGKEIRPCTPSPLVPVLQRKKKLSHDSHPSPHQLSVGE